ncbi:ABC-type amino acid transport substrate-binding protein [Solimonas aquatica]|uniref:ABC-type amino acid transport substrate-binding protein n=1 Tax=Solimonas aquatica TaxID=489703 RepID=A0A1H8ZQJ1_9GAMM|nr:transporter substrate-binding domain-containing protein [Solimonas aquatica]SEP66769.1 ABC-type amino acid transport substrate-binding protein [Solimonas aquatica]
MSITELRGKALRVLLLLLALPLASVAAAEDRLDTIRERGELSVAVYRDFAPYSYADADGHYVGIDVDLAKALAQALAVKLDLRPVIAGEDSDDDLRVNIWRGPLINGSPSDLMLHIGLDPEYIKRTDKAELFGAYQRETVSVIYRKQQIGTLDTPLKLAGQKVGVEVDSISDYYMSGAFNGRLRTSAVRLLSVDEAVARYLKGELDAVMAPRGQLEGALFRAHADAAAVTIGDFVGLFRTQWDVGMAIKAGNPELKAALQAALSQLRESGRLREIYASHGVTLQDPLLRP